jgi:hypothetical protein
MHTRLLAVGSFVLLSLAFAAAPCLAQQAANATLYAWQDLPKSDVLSHELSGIAWDGAANALYAISDAVPRIVPLRPSADFKTWTFGDPIDVRVPTRWDGEGIALTASRFYISIEARDTPSRTEAKVYELDRSGAMVAEVPLPAHFLRTLDNLGPESVSLTLDKRYLFTANEQALAGDGPQPAPGVSTTIRILRRDMQTGEEVEFAYRLDPGAGWGVSDIAALSATDILVLDRQFVVGAGNTIRIYRVDLSSAGNVIDVEDVSTVQPVAKTLFLDLATLPDDGFPTSLEPQANKILDNFEGIAVGPMLPNGRQALFLISDDNTNPIQVPRLLILSVAPLVPDRVSGVGSILTSIESWFRSLLPR